MITPRQASPSVQSLFAPQTERAAVNQGKKPLGGVLVDDIVLNGKRSTSAVAEKKPARGVERKSVGGRSDESFGAQLEKAVNRTSRAERPRTSDAAPNNEDVRSTDQAALNESAGDRSAESSETDRTEKAPGESDVLREGQDNGEETIEALPPAVYAECAVKPTADEAHQDRPAGEVAADVDDLNPADEAPAKGRGAFVKAYAESDASTAGAEGSQAGHVGQAVELLDGEASIDATGLKVVTPESSDLRSGAVAGDDHDGVIGDEKALRTATLDVDANDERGPLAKDSASIEDARTTGTRDRGEQVANVSEYKNDGKLIDQRAEIVSRTSRLAVLKAQPLTIDSLNELLVTIDPSLASQILRPTSLNAAAREGVSDEVKDVLLRARPERTHDTQVEGDTFERQANRENGVRERLSESSGLASQGEASMPGDRGSFNDRGATRFSDLETSAKILNDQRQGELLPERGTMDSAKLSQASAPAGGALNVLNLVGATAGVLSDSLRNDANATTAGDAGVKTQTIATGPTTQSGASGSAMHQGTRDEQGSSLLQQNARFGSLTDDLEGDRAMNAAVASQLTRGVSTALRQRVGSMVMKLQPESLGQVRVNIDFASNTLYVRFDTASVQASQAIQSAMSDLKASLASRGYNLGEARVKIDPMLSDSLRTSDATVSSQTAEVIAHTSARTSDMSQSRANGGTSRPSKPKSSGDSIEREGGETGNDGLLTVNARGEVVQTKLSAVG
ncbi:MAG: flagellar hook-length control protein FliK [Phycisphaerales bacterium]|nr:flagellar hook-length control protein FliK [Phycisphaerales bacterium]